MHTDPEGFEEQPSSVRPIDEEQARLLSVLRAARGRPVTFAELHELGIGNPAVLCYELEIAGVPVTRVERPRIGGAPVPVGVQLDERWFAAPPAAERPRWPRWAASTELRRDWRGVLLAMLASVRTGSGRVVQKLRTPAGGFGEQAAELGERSRALAGSTLALVAERWQRIGEARPKGSTSGAAAAPLRSRTALLTVALALVAVVSIAALVSSGGASHGPSAKVAAHRHGARAGSDSPAVAGRARGPLGTPSAQNAGNSSTSGASAAAKPASTGGEAATRATQLQSEGHQLLDEGRYAAAASDLRAAIAASDGSPGRCQEPSSEACLAYAYALYDLGRALQAQHNPSAAVPILNKRLRIDNQRSTVLAQLNSARAQLHQGAGSAPVKHHQGANTHEQPQTPRATQPAAKPEPTGEQPQKQTTAPAAEGHAGEPTTRPTGEAGSAPSQAGEAPSAPGGGTRG
jgi:hypothetical protein